MERLQRSDVQLRTICAFSNLNNLRIIMCRNAIKNLYMTSNYKAKVNV